MTKPTPKKTLPASFGEALRLLRKRARLTQGELGQAVGYSREQIARLENGSRLPDLVVVAALFIPALGLDRQERLAEELQALAGKARMAQSRHASETNKAGKSPRRMGIKAAANFTPSSPVVISPDPVALAGQPVHFPPTPLLPLLGRDPEVAGILDLLQANRLITIIGAPGIGKTRLAMEIALLVAHKFAQGVVFVSLANVPTAGEVVIAVSQALALGDLGSIPAAHQTLNQAISAYLRPRSLLLVLDNCEHILDSASNFAEWLALAPRLKLLCTSRTPLDLYGEQEFPLSPLPVPDLAQPPDLDTWGQCASMQLLLARARAGDPSFALTQANLLPLATLCVALDGLPLALELVVGRLRELTPQSLVQQLLMLRGNAQLSSSWFQQTWRNVAERHRTLRAAISWSFDMLPPLEQAAFVRLGVFAGGCSPEAAQAVAGADERLLAALARTNLIGFDAGRVTLLETLRTFALEQLIGSGQLAACQAQYAAFYTGFARLVFSGLLGDDQADWMQRALVEHQNCLDALRWLISGSDGEGAVALASSLWWFWFRRGWFQLGKEMLQAALSLPLAAQPDLHARARALNGLASIHLNLEEFEQSLARHQEGLLICRELGDPDRLATVFHNLGLVAFMMGSYAEALAYLDESIAVSPSTDPTQAWVHKGIIALEMLDLPQAKIWLEQALERVIQQEAGWLRAYVLDNLAEALREAGSLPEARVYVQESLALYEAMGDSYYLPDPQFALAQIAAAEGDTTTALALSNQALAQYTARQDVVLISSVLLFHAEIASQAENASAETLFQQALALRHSVKRPLTPREQAHFDAVGQRFESTRS